VDDDLGLNRERELRGKQLFSSRLQKSSHVRLDVFVRSLFGVLRVNNFGGNLGQHVVDLELDMEVLFEFPAQHQELLEKE
jgi:hypothetical protein